MDVQSSSTCKGGVCSRAYKSTTTTIHITAWRASRDPTTIHLIYIILPTMAAASIFTS